MDTDYPVFRKLLNMFVINYDVYFEVQVLNTLEFNYHYHCFVIQILFKFYFKSMCLVLYLYLDLTTLPYTL